MSFEEKNTWIYAVVTLVCFGIYWWIILGRAQGISITEVPYAGVMLWTIGAAVLASVVGNVAVSIAAPKEAGKQDQRDREINRYSDSIGYYVLSLSILVALGLTMLKAPHFWIANAIYFAFVLTAFWTSVVKIMVYRRGF